MGCWFQKVETWLLHMSESLCLAKCLACSWHSNICWMNDWVPPFLHSQLVSLQYSCLSHHSSKTSLSKITSDLITKIRIVSSSSCLRALPNDCKSLIYFGVWWSKSESTPEDTDKARLSSFKLIYLVSSVLWSRLRSCLFDEGEWHKTVNIPEAIFPDLNSWKQSPPLLWHAKLSFICASLMELFQFWVMVHYNHICVTRYIYTVWWQELRFFLIFLSYSAYTIR